MIWRMNLMGVDLPNLTSILQTSTLSHVSFKCSLLCYLWLNAPGKDAECTAPNQAAVYRITAVGELLCGKAAFA